MPIVTSAEPKSLPVLAKKYLALPEETFLDFKAQWDKLTPADKSDLRAAFEAQGIPVKTG